jgi:hypothetical protein
MGFYPGALTNGGLDRYANANSFLYREQSWLECFNPFASFAEISGNSGYIRAVQWKQSHPGGKVVLGIAPLPSFYDSGGNPRLVSGFTWAQGAAGAYDAHFVTLAQGLVNAGLEDAVIRIAYEFNGPFMPWHIRFDDSTTGDERPANFRAYWRKIVTAMRTVEGQKFKFCWNGSLNFNINGANTKTIIQQCYPGDDALPPELDYVDYVGVDFYDSSYAANTYPYTSSIYPYGNDAAARQQAAWNDNVNNASYGVYPVWRAIARAHNKPLVFPEWGLMKRSKDGHGGLDNPNFIQNMYNLIHETGNNVAWHIYFDYNSGGTLNSCITTQPSRPTEMIFPVAQAKYRQLFGIRPLPDDNDIGTVGLAGGSDPVTVKGAGTGFAASGTSDNFHFSSGLVNGANDVFMAKITSASIPAGQSGVMVRESTAPGAPYAALFVSGGNCVFQIRTTLNGAATVNASASGVVLPLWLKVVRRGADITGYRSSDGVNWTYAGGKTVNLSGTTISMGVAVSSGSTTALNTVIINKVDDYNLLTAQVPAGAIIKDDSDTTGITNFGFGNVFPRTGVTGYGDYIGQSWRDAGGVQNPKSFFTWTPTLTAGLHDVYAHWPTKYTLHNRVPIDIVSADAPVQLFGNQNEFSGQWYYAGTYAFNSGASGSVTFSRLPNLGNNYTEVDAVMFVPLPAAPLSQLPAPKVDTDVGNPSVAGSATFSNGVYTVNGAGPAIDQFNYVNRDLTGTQTLTMRVTGLTGTSALTGVMIRKTTATNSAFVYLTTSTGGTLEFRYRAVDGGATNFSSLSTGVAPSPSTPLWLRLFRNANGTGSHLGSWSTNGTTWNSFGTAPTLSIVNPDGSFKAGGFVTSRTSGILVTATWDNVTP